ncbi:SPOR domain-containing protein [Novosphingobium sp.]|uniref:SPOR domain-containing protein n=1 Tax=Novosphingobium sp. TaxID=1874826 RepID=UPI00273337EC|nr:SPOR domain-containing protein [Novosphingobium sp.]MDP3908372.1 SPOR domain-containing protein [Novosphingobium sp.]
MNRKIAWSAALAAAGVILSPAALADTKAGVDAWTRGDFPAAVKQWQASAARGDADAQFNLGQAYKLGKGVKPDLVRAEEYFGKAAALGHLQASDNYGLLLFQRGERRQALPFIRAAADRGDPRSQYLLGIGHFNGDIVPKDWVRAYALVSLAQQSGLEQARTALTQMDQHVPLAQRQEAVALSAELQSQTEATRARQFASADLGNSIPNVAAAPPASVAPVTVPRAPTVAAATDAVAHASRVAGTDSPATAGADYARPAAATPPPATTAVRPAIQPPRPVTAPVAAPTTASGPWRVQLGAFGVAANADALWARLRLRPELAGHPRINVAAGAVTKLQAGGFASEAAARAACTKLVASGFTCIPARN